LRVNPDAPLSNVFNTVSNKLKLDDTSKGDVEFRHPQKHDVKLNTDKSLNHYNLREVYLTQKSGKCFNYFCAFWKYSNKFRGI